MVAAMKYSDLPVDERRAISARAFELRKKGVPAMEIARQFRMATRTLTRIMIAGGDWPVVPVDPDKPTDPPPISMQTFTKPTNLRLAVRKPLLYFNACPRGCNGTVEVTNTEATCLSCGWHYQGRGA